MARVSPEVAAYWQLYCDSLAQTGKSIPTHYSAWGFGDSPAMADELGALVVAGVKTATASLEWVFALETDADDEVMPQVGDFNLILNGKGEPLCIYETVEVQVKPYDAVDAAFAFDEGEGDRSLTYWREEHWRFFTRECERIGRTPSTQMPVVCERFRVVFVK